MHWKTLKIATVVALLASPSAFAALPGPDALDGAAVAAQSAPEMLLAHQRGDRHGRFEHRRPRDVRDGRHHRGRDHFHRGRGHHHPHFRHHHHRPRHYRGHRHDRYHGRPARRLFRHWLRHHYH